jgi:hypothetical protein
MPGPKPDPGSKERRLEESRAWKRSNPALSLKLTKQWRARNFEHVLLNRAKSRAEKLGLPFDLDIDWVIAHTAPMMCEVTSHRLEWVDSGRGRGFKHPWAPYIDRRDSALGYTKDNCRVVSTIYNIAKSNWSDDVVDLFRKTPTE